MGRCKPRGGRTDRKKDSKQSLGDIIKSSYEAAFSLGWTWDRFWNLTPYQSNMMLEIGVKTRQEDMTRAAWLGEVMARQKKLNPIDHYIGGSKKQIIEDGKIDPAPWFQFMGITRKKK